MKKCFLCFVAVFVFSILATACGDDSGDDSDTDTDVTNADIAGIAAKGPIIANSPVAVQQLNTDGTEVVGSVANGNTLTALGDFALSVPVGTNRLTVSGPYYNEHSGQLSISSIDLQAVAHIDGATNVFVNTFTHMTTPRVVYLMSGGLSDVEAIAQAGNELYQELGIHHPDDTGSADTDGGTDGGTFDIGLGTEMNPVADNADGAYALALSCIISKAAYLIAADENEQDSKLQYLLNNIALDIRDDGIIDGTYEGTPYKDIIRNGEAALNPVTDCTDNLHDYLESELGADAPTLPDIDQSVDNDGDGTPNSEDLDDDGDGINDAEDEAPYDASVGGGMYIDLANNLGWQLTPPDGLITWTDAQAYCDGLSLGGYVWRMPTIDESETLVFGCEGSSCALDMGPDDGCYWPIALDGTCDGYWTSTECATNSYNLLFFTEVVVDCMDSTEMTFKIRCVRNII